MRLADMIYRLSKSGYDIRFEHRRPVQKFPDLLEITVSKNGYHLRNTVRLSEMNQPRKVAAEEAFTGVLEMSEKKIVHEIRKMEGE